MGALLLLWMALASPATANGRLVVCDDVKDPLTLDPHKQFSEKNHTIVQQIYEGLLRFDSDGHIEPALAVSWERIDPLRMRFYLREGVHFHNGETFDAESVRFTIQRYLNPATGFPALGFISTLEKAEPIDPHTVDIVTKYPDGLLLNRLAGFILIVPPNYVKDKGENALSDHPIGTGPFRFAHWDKGKEIALAANKDYWAPQYPKTDELIFRFVPSDKQVSELIDGKIDILTELPGTQTESVIRSGRIKVVKKPSFYTVAGSLNTTTGPLADKKVRQALNYAINKEELIRYDLLGNGLISPSVTMPGEEGNNPTLKPYPYDHKKAVRLLKEAGYPRGFTLEVAAKEQGERAASIIAKQLESVGIHAKLKVFTDSELIPALTKSSWDIVFGGCPDPMAHSFFIQSIFLYSESPYSISKNPRYDSLLKEMATTVDDKLRKELAEKLDKYIYDEALLLFTYQRIKTYGTQNNVIFRPAVTGMPYFFNAAKSEGS